MNKVISVEVWPKKREPGAFQVKITTLDGAKTHKWFNGEKIRPAEWLGLATWLYSLCCRLIEQSAREKGKIIWRHDQDYVGSGRSLPRDKGAYANQYRNKAIGTC